MQNDHDTTPKMPATLRISRALVMRLTRPWVKAPQS